MGYNTIKITKYVDVIIERVANAAITPGMLIELMSTNKVKAHATAGGNIAPIMIALENELEGEDIDTNYAAADQVQCWVARPGDVAYLILSDGQNASIGSYLESAGNGYVNVHTVDSMSGEYSRPICAMALEALDLSGSSGEESSGVLGYNKRIKAMIV
jgi:hypothetical protein